MLIECTQKFTKQNDKDIYTLGDFQIDCSAITKTIKKADIEIDKNMLIISYKLYTSTDRSFAFYFFYESEFLYVRFTKKQEQKKIIIPYKQINRDICLTIFNALKDSDNINEDNLNAILYPKIVVFSNNIIKFEQNENREISICANKSNIEKNYSITLQNDQIQFMFTSFFVKITNKKKLPESSSLQERYIRLPNIFKVPESVAQKIEKNDVNFIQNIICNWNDNQKILDILQEHKIEHPKTNIKQAEIKPKQEETEISNSTKKEAIEHSNSSDIEKDPNPLKKSNKNIYCFFVIILIVVGVIFAIIYQEEQQISDAKKLNIENTIEIR